MEQQKAASSPGSGASKAAPMLGAVGGGCAVLIGLILLIAFFLPWSAGGYGSDEKSAFEILEEDSGSDSALGNLLSDFIVGSTALAGCGSMILGLGLAAASFIARRNAALRSWMASSVGCMVVLAAFLPCFHWTYALLGDYTDDIKIGVWLSLGGAVLLVIASLVGLLSAFMTQRQRS
jgi:hypothetical protein